MHLFTSKRAKVIAIVAALFVLSIIAIPTINVNRYRLTVAKSLSNALGREVSVSGVELNVLPPGLTLNGVVVSDDPQISFEPILRADEVNASLRLSSLWRGRLEISKLSLKYPSFNLVHGTNQHWNIETLLERAQRTPTAPTDQTRPEARIRFPYIEAAGGRINLKIGQEKKVFALSDADLSLWLQSENEWRLRLEARPIRADANLGDTGTIKIDGTLLRREDIYETPISLRFVWQDGQLGQITRLIYGRDRGWRGGVTVSGNLQGKPQDLRFAFQAALADFRRYDIATEGSVALYAQCSGHFLLQNHEFPELSCTSPIGDGVINVSGNVNGIPGRQSVKFEVVSREVPLQSLVLLGRHSKKDLPNDLNASGTVSAKFVFNSPSSGTSPWSGDGITSPVTLRSDAFEKPIRIAPVHLQLSSSEPGKGTYSRPPSKRTKGDSAVGITRLEVQPFQVSLDGDNPATARAWFSRDGYSLGIEGSAKVQRLMQIARALGFTQRQVPLEGTLARLSGQVEGVWSGFQPPRISGNGRLSDATWLFSGFSQSLEIASASVAVDPTGAAFRGLTAGFQNIPTVFTGFVWLPLNCDEGAGCPAKFELKADQLKLDELENVFNPTQRTRPWYAILPQGKKLSPDLEWKGVTAEGKINTGRFQFGQTTASLASANLRIASGKLEIENIRAEVFGGHAQARISADFTKTKPIYAYDGILQKASMADVAMAMNDGWASGTLNASLKGSAAGGTGEELMDSATGTLKFRCEDGTLSHVRFNPGAKTLHFHEFIGTLELSHRILRLNESKLNSPDGIYLASGTASLNGVLGLEFASKSGQKFMVKGPLERPIVTSLSREAEATLR